MSDFSRLALAASIRAGQEKRAGFRRGEMGRRPADARSNRTIKEGGRYDAGSLFERDYRTPAPLPTSLK